MDGIKERVISVTVGGHYGPRWKEKLNEKQSFREKRQRTNGT